MFSSRKGRSVAAAALVLSGVLVYALWSRSAGNSGGEIHVAVGSSGVVQPYLAVLPASWPSSTPGLTTTVSLPATAPTGPDADALKLAFATANSLDYHLGIVPSDKFSAPTLSSTDLDPVSIADTQALHEVFENGTALDRESAALATAIAADGSGIRSISGGVSHITYIALSIDGDKASVAGDVSIWSETIGQIGGKAVHFRPSDMDGITMTFDRVNGIWEVATIVNVRLSSG